MGTDPRRNGHNLSRLTISGGKKAEPRYLMAHPIGEAKPRRRWRAALAILAIVAAVTAIALAGRSS